MNTNYIRLESFPKKIILESWEIEYDIKHLVLNEKSETLDGLNKIIKSDLQDFKKLISTLKMQLMTRELLKNEKRVKKYKRNKKIIEFKSPNGYARLFGFIKDETIIICTNCYWKNSNNKAEQDAAFERAEFLMEKYLEQYH